VPEWDGAVPIPGIVKPKPFWSGKQILSMVIPHSINIHHSPDPKSSNPVFDNIMVENNEIKFGIVEKKTVWASQGGLMSVTPLRVYGPINIHS
jgi:DNA-directed RNA polymerase II subunit RPB1